jgi:hypothetical protein
MNGLFRKREKDAERGYEESVTSTRRQLELFRTPGVSSIVSGTDGYLIRGYRVHFQLNIFYTILP